MESALQTEFSPVIVIAVTIISILFVGFSKAGFGGGIGLLATPLLSLVFSPKFAIGMLLPLLIMADIITIYSYRRYWDRLNLIYLIPGGIIGIFSGVLFVKNVSNFILSKVIGATVLIFLLIQWLRTRLGKNNLKLSARWWSGTFTGVLAGTVSAIAHSAGIIIAMYLLPQKLDKRVFTSTMVCFFGVINATKVIPYLSIGLINGNTLKYGIYFIPVIPVGTALGFWLNRHLSQKTFTKIIYALVIFSGFQLLTGLNIFKLFS